MSNIRNYTRAAVAAALLVMLLAAPLTARAHEEVPLGKYLLEIGWVNEPVLLGETNGVFLSIVNTETDEPVEAVTTLQVSITTGGQTRELELHPLGEDAPGQYAGDFIPTVRGQYTVKLTGQIEEQAVDISQDIEEVELAEDLQFPITLPSLPEMSQQLTDLQAQLMAAQSQAASAQTLAIVGLAIGVIGAGLGVFALIRKK